MIDWDNDYSTEEVIRKYFIHISSLSLCPARGLSSLFPADIKLLNGA